MELERKMMSMKWSIENVKAPYESFVKDVELIDFFKNTSYFDETFKSLLKRNKELDKNFHELAKALGQLNMPDKELKEGLGQGYKEMLKIFTDQSKYFNEIYKKTGKLSKAAQKTQKYINKLTENYISEMGKLIYQMP
jgi:DNA-binding transcriptional regulator GbsR (MarR family)